VSSLWGWQARGARAGGKEVLDIHLLKPARFLAEGQLVDRDAMLHNEDQAPSVEWVEYPYRTAHPIIRWLPSKLAEWIAENKGVDLGIAPKQGQKWSVKELNDILLNNLVECKSPNKGEGTGHLRTFGAVQWENDLFNGRPKARCYPFDLDGHRFRHRNPQVCPGTAISYVISYMISYAICRLTQEMVAGLLRCGRALSQQPAPNVTV